MANGFFTMSPRRKRKIQAETVVSYFLVALSSQHHFTAFFTLHLKLNLLSALQIKQATFSVCAFLRFCSDGLMAFMLVITGSKTQKIKQESYPRVLGSNWQFLAHKLLPPPPCLLIHLLVSGHPSLLSSSTSLYLTGFYTQKDAGFRACCASWQIPVHQAELRIGRRQKPKTRPQDTSVLYGLNIIVLNFELLFSKKKHSNFWLGGMWDKFLKNALPEISWNKRHLGLFIKEYDQEMTVLSDFFWAGGPWSAKHTT